MTISKQDESHRRSATRAPVDKPIKLQFDDSMEVIEGHCHNISIGGMFILYDHSRPAGSLVRFELEIAENSAIRGLGEVVWMRSKNDFGGPEAGFGLKFRFLEQRDRQLIFKLVSQHIKERLSRRVEPEGTGVGVAASPEPQMPPSQRQQAPPVSIAIPPDPEPTLEPGIETTPAIAPPQEPADHLPVTEQSPAFPSSLADGSADGAEEANEPVLAESPDAPAFDSGAIDLDPSVGETPIYELGLDSKVEPRRPSFFSEPQTEPTSDPSGRPASGRPAATPPSDQLAPLPALADAGFAEEATDPSSPAWAGDRDSADDFAGGPAGESSRREFSLLPVIAVLLAAGAAGFYLFKDQIMQQLGGDSRASHAERVGSVSAPADGKPPSAAAAADRSADAPPAESVGTSGAPPQPAAQEDTELPLPAGQPATSSKAALDVAADVASTQIETATPTPGSDSQAAGSPPAIPRQPPPPPTRVAPAAPPQAATTEPAADSSTAAFFSHLRDISWQEVPGGLRVVLTADGAIPTGRYEYFRLGGKSPREVVKLAGMARRFERPLVEVGGPAVRQIRTGFHRKEGGNEIHVVIDLLGAEWKLTEVRNQGDRLELLISQ